MNFDTLHERLEELRNKGITLIAEPGKKYYFSVDSDMFDVSKISKTAIKRQRLPVIQDVEGYLKSEGWTRIFKRESFGWTLGAYTTKKRRKKKVIGGKKTLI